MSPAVPVIGIIFLFFFLLAAVMAVVALNDLAQEIKLTREWLQDEAKRNKK